MIEEQWEDEEKVIPAILMTTNFEIKKLTLSFHENRVTKVFSHASKDGVSNESSSNCLALSIVPEVATNVLVLNKTHRVAKSACAFVIS